ncbi:hypothetical protein B4589_000745 [Halolamina sp. CBA1230]|uniref:DUF7522 family protein n=1 Tax=Halolamina sp. CBA1230 TaxID=1853690 RepID=UPI0009A16E0F|nr:hypothetical protein [Halolamina sp. CBA1230]QKY18969.1 hypothetical protein B4589_000745 [Halolamina sp. CBA1230]
MERSVDNPTDQRLSALEHACRGVVGDRLRSVSVDGPEYSGTLYRRSDLAPGVDGPVHEAMAAGASCEVFADGGRSVSPSDEADGGRPEAADGRSSPPTAAADGRRTVCAFDRGYVTRIRVGDTSVVATSDGIKMDRDTELSTAVRRVIGE